MVTDDDGDTIQVRQAPLDYICIDVRENAMCAAVMLNKAQAEALMVELQAALDRLRK